MDQSLQKRITYIISVSAEFRMANEQEVLRGAIRNGMVDLSRLRDLILSQ